MFNLEKEIQKWKKSLRKNKSFEDGSIEELESHLRDEIQSKIAEGFSEEQAFRDAVKSFGNVKKLNKEYSKSTSPLYQNRKTNFGEIWMPALFMNYIKIAIRSLKKNVGYSIVNIGGLAIGMAVCIFITLFIRHELSYDKHNQDHERIYRVVKDFVFDDGVLPDATTPPALAPTIKKDIPEIEESIRIMPSWGSKFLIKSGEKKFYEDSFLKADSNFFSVFTVVPVTGDLKTSLIDQSSIVLTESMAGKYFGDDNPVGKTLLTERSGRTETKTVTAVIKDFPDNAHFDFDFLIPMNKGVDERWGWYNFYTYIKLKENASYVNFDEKVQEVFKKNNPENRNVFYSQPLTDIHLKSQLKWELGSNGDISQVYTFATIALFVIIIAAINFINLSTARSTNRAKEVGIRKVNGAFRFSLIKQFLLESAITSFVSFTISVVLMYLLLPFLNSLFETNLDLLNAQNVDLVILMGSIAIFVGLVAGLYPALYLSGFQPVYVLKGLRNIKGSLIWLRKGLVVTQFVISGVLITGTLIIDDQLQFIRNFDLGFDKEQVMVIPNADNIEGRESFKNDLIKLASVNNVGNASGVIGGLNWTNAVRSKESEKYVLMNFQYVDYSLLDLLKIKMEEGRKFSKDFPADYENGIILTKKGVSEIGLEEPVTGKQVIWSESEDTTVYRTVIGVANDFIFTSLHQEIKPFAFLLNDDELSNLFIKVNTANFHESLSAIKEKWNQFVSDRPFEYYFLDNTFDQLHKADKKFSEIFNVMTSLAIFIACLGLFALTAYTVEKKTKEIGVRKVLGASVRSIVSMLSLDLLKLVLVANLIALPATYFVMNKWLEEFAYRIEITIWVFVLSAIVTVLISLLTISFQSIKAALANPIKSLKYE